MKVQISRGGMLAPVVTTTSLDSDQLSAEEARALRDLVAKSALHTHKASRAASTQPDRGGYRIRIEDGPTNQDTSLADEAVTPQVRELIDWVDAAPAAVREMRRPGSET